MPDSRAETIVPCDSLDDTLNFFTKRLGFKVDSIFPADAPRVAVLAGHGTHLRLTTEVDSFPPHIRLVVDEPALYSSDGSPLVAPNGSIITVEALGQPLVIPEATDELVVSRSDDGAWGIGRAGMQYRDLIPSRLGGRFIASHISIPTGGPVPDYVHYHQIRFQMIFCRSGWAKLVYEDQGEPFLFEAGDCVLQPPEIRHRVLECSDEFEVVELGCPAEHITMADRWMPLPNGPAELGKRYGGQDFVRHVAKEAEWSKWRSSSFECRDTGIAAATDGLAGALVVRPTRKGQESEHLRQRGEFQFFFVLRGSCSIVVDGNTIDLGSADSVSIPTGASLIVTTTTADLELLDVALPAHDLAPTDKS